MATTHFELPANMTAVKLISALSDQVDIHLVSRQYLLKTYYDSFDWRLYRQGVICEFNRSKQSSSLMLTNRKNGELIASTLLFDVPAFSKQFNPGKVRQTLEPLLGVRALLAICTLECEAHHLDILNKDEKIVLRVLIEQFDLLNNRLTLFPVKGYDKTVGHITEMVTKELGVTVADKPVLLEALRLQGRLPKDYSSKLDIKLTPEMRADVACKTIFSYLLRVIKLNEQGTIADTDSEFLHDFRVAVRRTRVALSQVKHVLPEDVLIIYREFFSWLGQITGETRDLDVYLLNFEQYKKKLPPVIRQSINPLHNFLQVKKQKSHKQLAKKLRSAKYLTTLAQWETYLSSSASPDPTETNAHLTIKELADKRIWKTYKLAVKEGDAIDRHSPSGALHKLRKTCKKLRYLMEFFQNLYPDNQTDKLIKRLKQLQEVLGDYQDYSVQQEQLQQFSEEMQTINTPSRTFLAMGVLIQDFENRKCKARDSFTSQFTAFKKQETHTSFHDLFAPRKT
ncbi:CHAD domain-containing protein [Methyloglobulus morosus KoM1]|uniref:CHAD domain-containing protein n=1 Tax=Methyloglobulus morosus KoM1 TaxID=1116472 RepID=V5BF51_9GAMM|nr:CHAD domain-containing protein [Methyloglobulus morosus]ESS71925.1 CHAD domain-containing protein [Methyloglobulus morosus KoM1]